MKSHTPEIEALRATTARAALDQCYSLLKTDKEAVQAAHWAGLPMGVRRVAVMSANLPKERAGDTLNKFDALERGRINVCVQRLLKSLELVSKCMQGGAMPATEAVH